MAKDQTKKKAYLLPLF